MNRILTDDELSKRASIIYPVTWGTTNNPPMQIAFKNGYSLCKTHTELQLKAFIQNLCNTNIVDLYTPEQLLEIFWQNKF